MADIDFTKRRLVEQHEEDMEQLMMLKKQLEKKVSENIEYRIRKYWNNFNPKDQAESGGSNRITCFG